MIKYFLLFTFFLGILEAEPIVPIPLSIETDEFKVRLGKKLFFDTILSANNTISCASCHSFQNGGGDGLKFSFGIHGQEGNINAPTVFNAVYNFKQFWNGRADNLAHQALGPIENPIEMGHTFKALIKILNDTPYKIEFETIYKDGVTRENIADAIAEYEKTLTTPNAPIDKHLRGDEKALTIEQRDGYRLFKEKGCISCHHGVNIGGNLFNKFGVMKETNSRSLGRYEVTGNEAEKYYFKVPTLRNIALTSPYLHDGRYENLEDAVKFMARYQLGKTISEDEIKKIIGFLNSLTGEIPKK